MNEIAFCSQAERNQQIVDSFERFYLFREQIQVPVLLEKLTASELVEQLKVREFEDFSFWVEDAASYQASFTDGLASARFGFTVSLAYGQQQALVRVVEMYSPAWHQGLARGDEIIAINHVSIEQFFQQFRLLQLKDEVAATEYYLTFFGYDDSLSDLQLELADGRVMHLQRGDYQTSSIIGPMQLQYQQQDVAI